LPDKEIGRRGKYQEHKPETACFVIKIQGENNHVDYSRAPAISQGVIDNIKADKQEQE
jgi:hypothetical protein